MTKPEAPTPPSRTFEIQINGETKPVTMSWALFQELMRVIPDPQNIVAIIMSDFELRDFLVRRVITGKKRIKDENDLFDLYENNVDDDQLDDLVIWIVDHILHFFTSTGEKSQALARKYEEKMKSMTRSDPSQTGSPA